MNKKFGTHAGSVTPKTQATHGKALGIAQVVVPPHKKGPPLAQQPSLLPQFPPASKPL
jgi:hypothetical protein